VPPQEYLMPPYKPNKSKAQQRKMFALVKQGKLSQQEAEGKARASKGKQLPEKVRKTRRK
jgi:hypothetical protein